MHKEEEDEGKDAKGKEGLEEELVEDPGLRGAAPQLWHRQKKKKKKKAETQREREREK